MEGLAGMSQAPSMPVVVDPGQTMASRRGNPSAEGSFKFIAESSCHGRAVGQYR
jgi:hypothetical protein